MIPPKLKQGDEIRIVSPSGSLSIISKQIRDIAKRRLEKLGFKVTFSKNVEESDGFDSSSIKSRVDDLHEAFRDKNVKAILISIGGFNSNQLLNHLDYDLIKENPKILCGYSDITALQGAIYKKTRLVTYSGPFFSTFGLLKGFDPILQYFKKCLMKRGEFEVNQSEEWSNDKWYKNQKKRTFHKNERYKIINEGEAEGKIIGGNLCTLNLLQGTEYMPELKDTIIFLEDDKDTNSKIFDRDIQSLIHQPGFSGVKGIVIGRFEKASKITREELIKIIKTKKELDNLPVISDADFGHTFPLITYPIGGKCKIYAKNKKVEIKILEH